MILEKSENIDLTEERTAPVSVVIPCFNSVKTLERAVKSVVKQTLRPAELVLVDDGSTDSTVEFMYELQKKYGKNWIQIIELGADLGVSTARNSGWERVNNKFIAFLDSDDSWHLKKIEIQYNFMIKNENIVMSGTGFDILTEDDSEPFIDAEFEIKEWSPKKMLLKNPFVTPGVMIRADIKERFQDGRSDMDDHLLWLEIAFNHGFVSEIKLPLAILFKAQWGEGGLGSRLWIMEKGELKNYWYLRQNNKISMLAALGLSFFSLIKFIRRLYIRYILKRSSSH